MSSAKIVLLGLLLLPIEVSQAKEYITKTVMVSTYNATEKQCGPNRVNSAGYTPRLGDAAISPRLRKTLGLSWGDKVSIEGREYTLRDHTNKRFVRTIDILIEEGEEHWREERVVIFYKENKRENRKKEGPSKR